MAARSTGFALLASGSVQAAQDLALVAHAAALRSRVRRWRRGRGGRRMLVANAIGCSSIYGGNLPTTPWSTDAEGRGPAWANSLSNYMKTLKSYSSSSPI